MDSDRYGEAIMAAFDVDVNLRYAITEVKFSLISWPDGHFTPIFLSALEEKQIPWENIDQADLEELLVSSQVDEYTKEAQNELGGKFSDRREACLNAFKTLLGAVRIYKLTQDSRYSDFLICLNLLTKQIKGGTEVSKVNLGTEESPDIRTLREVLEKSGQNPLFSLKMVPANSLATQVAFLCNRPNWR